MSERNLRDTELFAYCTEETLRALSTVIGRRELSARDILFSEGDTGSFMFVVQNGRLAVEKNTPTRGTVTLRHLQSGDVGGLTSMTTHKTRSATVTALEPSIVTTITKENFNRIADERPDLSRSLIAFLARKVRHKTQSIASYIADTGQTHAQVAMFDTKPYEEKIFSERHPEAIHLKFLEPRLDATTASLAEGHLVVCAFVNDCLDKTVLQKLAEAGVGLIALRCAGYNNVDTRAAAQLGIDIVRVPAYSPHAVAEHAVALILSLNRKIHRAYNRVHDGNFSLAGLVGFDLFGKTAGIVGLGKIGRCLASILKGFGMSVLAYDTYRDETYAQTSGVNYVALDELIERSDIISLHTPLIPSTYHLIDAKRIEHMKRGVMLINTSRGGLIDAQALIDALKSGHVGSAGLDVYEEESEYFFEDRSDKVITDDLLARLMTFNNVVITSHQAFLTTEALSNIADTTLSNIQEWLSGRRGEKLTNFVGAAEG